MSNIDITSMFDSIKESLSNDKSGGNGSYRDIMKLKAGNTYLVRILPNVVDPKETFYHYFHHGWTSNQTGQYVDGMCQTTWGERCPICEDRFKLYRAGSENDKSLSSLIRRMEKHFVNVYVVDDPTNEDNNGTIKILRMGVRLYGKVQEAVEGDDADEFGPRVFDLTENGCNLKIKVETTMDGKRQFTNYSNSRFTAPAAIPGMTPAKIKEVYESIFNLSDHVDRKTTEELSEMLQTHLYCKPIGDNSSDSDTYTVASAVESIVIPDAVDEDEDEAPATAPKTKKASKPKVEDVVESQSNEDKIKDLLDGIDDIDED